MKVKGTLKLEDGREIAVEFESNDPFLNKPNKPPKRWRAKLGMFYSRVNIDGTIIRNYDYRDTLDDHLYSIGNYFKTNEEAESYLEKQIKVQAIKDRIAELNAEWHWTPGEEYTIINNTTTGFAPDTYGIVNVWPDSLKMRNHAVANAIILEFGDQLNAIFT